ncbi:hypothetical protein BGX38DRAFT_696331 [Terfezia claveryi]|nr:hypothetical protein BGX38DRAFT_696331 [Terfezia claveryi]
MLIWLTPQAAACHPQHSRDITDAVISSVPATNPPPASEPSQASSSASTSERRLIVQPLGPDLPPFQAEPYKIATLRMQFFWFLIVRRVHELFLHNTKLLLLGRADLQRKIQIHSEKGGQDDISEVLDFWLKRKRMWELTKTVAQSKKGWVWRETRDQTADSEEKVIEASAAAFESRFPWLKDLAKGRQAGEWVTGGTDNTGELLWHDSRKGSCTWDGDCECVFTPGGSELRGPWAWRGSTWGGTAWGDLVMWLLGLCRAHLIQDVDNRSPNRDTSNSEDVEALDEHGHVTAAREGTQSSNPGVTLKPDLSNLDWTTFCYLFPHTFSDIRCILHMHPGNPSMNLA